MTRTCFFVFLLLCYCPTVAQQLKPIKFKYKPLAYQPANFRIVSVTDKRKDSVETDRIKLTGKKAFNFKFEADLDTVLTKYLANVVKADTGAYPVTVEIVKLELKDVLYRNNLFWQLDCKINVWYEDMLLYSYKGPYFGELHGRRCRDRTDAQRFFKHGFSRRGSVHRRESPIHTEEPGGECNHAATTS